MAQRLIRFSEEHDLLRDSVKKWLASEVVPHHEGWEREGIIPRAIWRSAGENGFLCPWVPEEYGGVGSDFLASVVVLEEFRHARATGMNIGLHNDIVVPYIFTFGTEEQKRRYIPKCCSGEIVTAIAMTEPGAGSDLAAVRTTAVRDGDSYVINGQKTFISNGQHAELILVVARTDPSSATPHKGMSLFLVDSDTPGFSRGRNLEKLGLHAQDTSEMSFEDCRVPASALLGEPNRGFYMLMDKLQQERLIVALEGQNDAELALKVTLDYVKERHAFGGPLTKLQHVQFELAEMASEIEIGRTFADKCTLDHIAGRDIVSEVSMAKYWLTDMACRVVDRCVQLHGGYGYMMEYPIARMYQDVRVQRIYAGANEVMKQIIAKRLLA